ncbi:peptidylprolyl isomerase [Paenibacillus aceti]|uniref:peptidylprolyl isomerase n=1 Tax=Paenibacillus aceti TaxID=1820010 RepID=A0ABQ1VRK0_9BACL|nr:peptidylprolyl isomerase [Paenibacillus aceti]GGF89598.1 hypothetical protein GCM10010913_08760 [Paenibacillus aceti]
MEDKEKDLKGTGNQGEPQGEPKNGHEDLTGQAVPEKDNENSTEADALAEALEKNQTNIQDTQDESSTEAVTAGEEEGAIAEPDDRVEHPSWTSSQEPEGASKSGSKVWPIVSLVLAVLLVIVLIKPPFASNKAEAVATVNGVEISKDTLLEELASSGGGETALDNLINRELVNQEAKKANINITAADIDNEIAEYKEGYDTEEAFTQALESSGIALDQLKEQIDMQLKLTKLLESKVTVTDEQIKEIFEQYKTVFDTPEQVRLSNILVGTEDEAKEIVKQLKDGADFAELAKTKSLDTATKESGGDTGLFSKGTKEEAIEEVAFKLKKDEVSAPIKTEEGYQVIKLTEHKEAHQATLEEKKDEIRKGLVSQEISKIFSTWLEEVRSKAKITNKLTDQGDTTAKANDTAAAK